MSVASANKKEQLTQLAEDIKSKLDEIDHPLINHKWIDNDADKFKQVSVFPNSATYLLHYELMWHSDIGWEFHAEGDKEAKMIMEPFIKGYKSERYKLTKWKYGIKEVNYKNQFHKIVAKGRFKYVDSNESEYDKLVKNLSDQLVRLYEDINSPLQMFLNGKKDILHNTGLIDYFMQNKPRLNQILYGPPGTGKTYSTIDKVVEVCDPINYSSDNHEANKIIYDRLVKEGRVVFTTFHQSMSYEDFIEGIKPVPLLDEGKEISYDIEDGIFKRMCIDATFDLIRENKSQNTEAVLDYSKTYPMLFWKTEIITSALDPLIYIILWVRIMCN